MYHQLHYWPYVELISSSIGAISVFSSTIYISDSVFSRNAAVDVGVIQITEMSTATVTNTKFISNMAITNGVFRLSGNSVLNVSGSLFAHNMAEVKNSIGQMLLLL